MKKWSYIIFVLVLIFAAPLSAMATSAGIVTHIEGKGDIIRTGIPAAKALILGESVDVGDTIRTKSKSKAEITFGNKNILRIAASTRVVIQQYMVQGDNTAVVMKLYRGMVQAISSTDFIKRLAASPDQNKLEVHTINATCGIRGSNMIVSYYGGVTSVLFVAGRGYAYNPVRSEIVVPITAGNITFIEKKDSTPTPPRPISDIELNVKVKTVTPDKKSDGNSTLEDKVKSGDIPGVGSVPTDPGGLPPGLAGLSPGQSDNAPGQSGTAPGQSDNAPGQSGTAPGQSDNAPGQSGTAPGQSGTAPGQSGTAPGQSGTAPGQSGIAPGQSGTAPGQSGTAPGQSGTAPGQSGIAPGKSGTAPGQSGYSPGKSGMVSSNFTDTIPPSQKGRKKNK